MDQGKIDYDEYERQHAKIRKSVYDPKYDSSVTYTDTGKKYVEEYLHAYGNNINMGYIRDLGYDQKNCRGICKKD